MSTAFTMIELPYSTVILPSTWEMIYKFNQLYFSTLPRLYQDKFLNFFEGWGSSETPRVPSCICSFNTTPQNISPTWILRALAKPFFHSSRANQELLLSTNVNSSKKVGRNWNPFRKYSLAALSVSRALPRVEIQSQKIEQTSELTNERTNERYRKIPSDCRSQKFSASSPIN